MKKKKSILLLVVVAAVLAAAAYITFRKNGRNTLDEDSRNFAFADTASVSKIFIADKAGKKITLERNEKGSWMVNGKFEARPEATHLILKTLKLLEVKYPVSEKAKKAVIKDLASSAVKVEFYTSEGIVKSFYVGGETQDHTGTYMLLVDHSSGENYEQPYVMGLPGFEGYLTTRFFTAENEWKDTKVIDFTPLQLSSIRMEYTRGRDSSFMIKVYDTKNLQLCDVDGKPASFKVDPGMVKQYVAYFQNLHYERLVTDEGDKTVDSVRNSTPFAVLTITEKSGKINQYPFFFKAVGKGQTEKYGTENPYDPDRFFMEFNDRKEICLVQYYVFGKLLQTRKYFEWKTNVKK